MSDTPGLMLQSQSDYSVVLPEFLAYLAGGLVLFALFVALYMAITPHRELALIRSGNTAAAVSLTGALIGVAIPLSAVVASSAGLVDFVVWGAIALVVQLATFTAARLLVPGLVAAIEDNGTAQATLLAGLAVSVGIINAASITF